MKHPAFDELMAILREAFPNNSPRGQETMQAVREWQDNWFEVHGYQHVVSAEMLAMNKDSTSLEKHIREKIVAVVGKHAATNEAVISQKWYPNQGHRQDIAELFVIRKQSLNPMTPQLNHKIQASNAMDAAIKAVTEHQAGRISNQHVHDCDPYANIVQGFKSGRWSSKEQTIQTLPRENPKLVTGSKVVLKINGEVIKHATDVSFSINKKELKCECGKEKHGFASHAQWCDIKS